MLVVVIIIIVMLNVLQQKGSIPFDHCRHEE